MFLFTLKNKNKMLGLFNFKKNYFVGIDFGTSAIKLVELTLKNQKAHLVNYGWVDLGLDMAVESRERRLLTYDDKMKMHLQNLLNKIKPKSDSAYVSLPGFTGLITLLELPKMESGELEKAIHFEAHKYIPTSLTDVTLGWEIVSKKDDSNILVPKGMPGKIEVLLVAAPKKEVERYESIVSSTKMNVKTIELETFSLVRSLVGEDMGSYLIIDIGARATNIILVEKGVIRANRNINIGGNEITGTIVDSLKISKQRAEEFKKEDRDLLNSRESLIIMPTLEFVANESLRILSSYKEKNKETRIDSVIISGGSAKLRGIEEYFSKMLNIHSTRGNPWQKIFVEDRLAPAVKKIGTSFSVALGLALRGIEDFQRN
jgi:type IV pilus assembly protein PilM